MPAVPGDESKCFLKGPGLLERRAPSIDLKLLNYLPNASSF